MDGAYKGRFTDPGGFVQKNRTFTYVWEAREDSVGTWLYHDHGPMDPLPVFKGMFGPLIVRDPVGPSPPDKEFFLVMHSFSPVATQLNQQFACVNGRAYAGNTPTLRARVGQRVRLPRDRPRRRLPHLPPPRPSLGGHERLRDRGQSGHRQGGRHEDARAGRVVHASSSSRTTRAAGSTTATCSATCTWG